MYDFNNQGAPAPQPMQPAAQPMQPAPQMPMQPAMPQPQVPQMPVQPQYPDPSGLIDFNVYGEPPVADPNIQVPQPQAPQPQVPQPGIPLIPEPPQATDPQNDVFNYIDQMYGQEPTLEPDEPEPQPAYAQPAPQMQMPVQPVMPQAPSNAVEAQDIVNAMLRANPTMNRTQVVNYLENLTGKSFSAPAQPQMPMPQNNQVLDQALAELNETRAQMQQWVEQQQQAQQMQLVARNQNHINTSLKNIANQYEVSTLDIMDFQSKAPMWLNYKYGGNVPADMTTVDLVSVFKEMYPHAAQRQVQQPMAPQYGQPMGPQYGQPMGYPQAYPQGGNVGQPTADMIPANTQYAPQGFDPVVATYGNALGELGFDF